MNRLDPLLDRMFQRIDKSRHRGADMGAHMPTLYALARLCSFSGIVECGTGGGFSTHALLCGAIEGGGKLASYDKSPACGPSAAGNMGIGSENLDFARWTFTVKDSVEAAGDWKDGSVGLLFLDTSHRLDATRKELSAWLPKMHPDGIMCGHDYYLHLDSEWKDISGVKQAVDEFAERNATRFRLQVTPYDQGFFVLWPR